jgi:hypothetical protein
MLSIRIRRVVSILILAAATSMLPTAGLHAASRHEQRAERRVERPRLSIWKILVGLWEQAGLRIDDNG